MTQPDQPMTWLEAVLHVDAICGTVHGQWLLWILDGGSQSDQYDAASWCLAVDSVPAAWHRACAVLRLPEHVRRLARWN